VTGAAGGLKQKLDLQLFNQEKTEEATPKRKREAREKGQVAKSTDVNAAFVMLVLLLLLYWLRDYYLHETNKLLVFFMSGRAGWELSQENFSVLVQETLSGFFRLVAPVLVAAVIAASISNFAQVGFLVAPEAVKPKLENIDPIKGFKRIFSVKALVELAKSIVKISIVGIITYYLVKDSFTDLLLVTQTDARGTYQIISAVIFKIAAGAVAVFSIVAALDYVFQRRQFKKQLRMTKQEVKEEFKQTEGDPQLRAKLRARQRELATRRMMQAVPESTVIITNPTHLAIALKYEPGEMEAPVVVAKGADFLV